MASENQSQASEGQNQLEGGENQETQKVSSIFSKYWDFIQFADFYATSLKESSTANVSQDIERSISLWL